MTSFAATWIDTKTSAVRCQSPVEKVEPDSKSERIWSQFVWWNETEIMSWGCSYRKHKVNFELPKISENKRLIFIIL